MTTSRGDDCVMLRMLRMRACTKASLAAREGTPARPSRPHTEASQRRRTTAMIRRNPQIKAAQALTKSGPPKPAPAPLSRQKQIRHHRCVVGPIWQRGEVPLPRARWAWAIREGERQQARRRAWWASNGEQWRGARPPASDTRG